MRDSMRRLRADCLKVLLKPVARYCLKNSMGLQDLVEMAKVVLMDSAIQEMQLAGQEINFSRISIMTGVHRKEVKRIHESGEAIEKPVNYLRTVLGTWEQDRRFRTKKGTPKVLSLEGDNSDFKRLVRLVTTDVNPAALLFELERTGAVKRVPDGVALLKGHYVEREKIQEGVKLLARDTEDLVMSVEENLLTSEEPVNLHGRTEYDNIYKSDIVKIRKWLIEQGSDFHRRTRDLLARSDKDVNPDFKKEGGAKVVVGTYSRIIS